MSLSLSLSFALILFILICQTLEQKKIEIQFKRDLFDNNSLQKKCAKKGLTVHSSAFCLILSVFIRVCSFIYSQFSSSSHSLLLFFSPRSLKWMSWFQNSVQRNKKKIIIWKLHKHKHVSFFFFCSSIHEKGTRFEKKQKKRLNATRKNAWVIFLFLSLIFHVKGEKHQQQHKE